MAAPLITSASIDDGGPVEIAPRIHWVGGHLPGDPFQCHAYLVEHGRSSVLLDPGSPLTFATIREKVERIVPFDHVRYFVCSHQDPDVAGALPSVDQGPRHPEAVVVTHGRAAALLKHYALRMPFWLIEENGWRLDLGGRVLRFVFTPYLHFPGAFCTFDEESGTLFSSDLFGGFTEGTSLYAESDAYFEEIRAFHEHYMPSREILVHGMTRLEELPLQRIAPQHGRIIPEPLVRPIIRRLKELECGLFLMTRTESGVRRLLQLGTMLHDMTTALVLHRDLDAVAPRLLERMREVFPVDALEFWVEKGDAGRAVHFADRDGFRGAIEAAPAPIVGVLGRGRAEVHHVAANGADLGPAHGGRPVLLVPLFAEGGERATSVAVLRLERAVEVSPELDLVLGRMSAPLGIAVQRAALREDLERALAELRRAQSQLVQAQKMEAIGSLAAGVAHEINTPTQYVGDNVTFLGRALDQLLAVARAAAAVGGEGGAAELARALRKAKLDYLLAEVPGALEQAKEGLQRITQIVSAMKEFSHPSAQEKEAVDLGHAVSTTLTVARGEWKYVADVEAVVDDDLPPVPAFRDEVNQVILNLVVNAAQAIGDATDGGATRKGKITVSARREGDWAVLAVADDGPGVPEHLQGRIFDPFFTTRPVGKGTGQGLAIVHRVVVERHGGRIELRSAPGAGATFVVKLPLDGVPRPLDAAQRVTP